MRVRESAQNVAGVQVVERPKSLLDVVLHTATTAKYQIKGDTSTFSNLHASCPGSCHKVCLALEPPTTNGWVGSPFQESR